MKKHLLSLFAMACMVFASSCTSEEIVSQSTGNEVKVTFTTHVRNDVKSRAVGDDTDGIDKLVFAVYDENKVLLEELTQTLDESDLQDAGAGKKKAEINVVLVKGQTYSFAFWAQDKDYSAYTFDPATKKVTINYNKTANNKNADAFFANDKFTVTGSFKKDITLKRPFAQVNFLTTEYDLNKAKAAGFEPSQSSIIVKNAATSLDILTGEVEGDVVAEFALANLLSDESTTIKNASNQFISWSGTQFMTTDNESYACGFKYLATAYFLPTAATTTSTITTSMMAKSSVDSKAPIELTVSDINAQRNYRTNIYGNLLTNNGQFNVTIDPGFDGDYSEKSEDPTTIVVATVAEANALFEGGKTNVTIQEAPTTTERIILPQTTNNITINFDFEENTTPGDIIIEYPTSAAAQPANIEINGDAGDLIINTPESTVTLNGSYTNVESTTANHTLIVPKGVTIGTLTLKQGNAKIYYGAVETIINEGKVAITWLVDSKEQLAQIATDVNAGNSFDDQTIALISDIDLNNEEWTPIGDDRSQRTEWHGIFDGKGYTVSNIKITKKTDREDDNKSSYGLFGNVKGTVKNLIVENVSISGAPKFIGALIGRLNDGLVENCHVKNSAVECNNWTIGGLIGQFNNGKISRCTVENTTVKGYAAVGAITGIALSTGERTIEDCSVSDCILDQNGSFGGDYEKMFGAVVGALYSGELSVNINNCVVKGTTIKGVSSNELCGYVSEGDKLIIDGYEQIVAGLGYNATKKEYAISSAEGLVAMSDIKIKGDEKILLDANIDLKDVEFNGLNAFNSENNNTFDGQGYTVSNWTYEGGASDMGFIKNWVGPIKNVKFENCNLKTNGRSAIVAAKVYGNIENVTVNNCSIEDSNWACGIIAGLYNSGSVSNCKVTNSSVKSNGGTGGIVGVINESAGERKIENCSVSNSTINNTGAYGEAYSGGGLVGIFNADGATYKIVNCTVANNKLEGGYVYEKYPANENVVEE